MPDWVTHVFIGLVLIELFEVRKKSLVLLGVILPDILPKLVLVRHFVVIPQFDYTWLGVLHTPFVFLLFTLLIAPVFRYNFWKVVLWLNIGAMSHFLSDALLRHFQGGVGLLYPISLKHYALHWVWPNESYLILIPVLLVYVSVIFFKKYYRKGFYRVKLGGLHG